jgi:prophage regulatory protein
MSAASSNSISFLRLPQVKARTGLSRSSIYAMISRGDFPGPVSLGQRAVAWIDFEVDDWISDRVAASRKDEVQE